MLIMAENKSKVEALASKPPQDASVLQDAGSGQSTKIECDPKESLQSQQQGTTPATQNIEVETSEDAIPTLSSSLTPTHKDTKKIEVLDELKRRILGVIYGNACGDAIGLLTEFMNAREAKVYYGDKIGLEFNLKVPDMHRSRFKEGDWTDDTDQMILIMLSIIDEQGKVSPTDYASKLLSWARKGFPELGDYAGMGLGATTSHVLRHNSFLTDPHSASNSIWELSGRYVAPNGALMRTSILGVFQYHSLERVWQNTLDICKVTHADPRCQASCVALTTAIALMLQKSSEVINKDGSFKEDVILQKSYDAAKIFLGGNKGYKKELKHHMFATKLSTLKLDESKKIGYTYKCLGAGFWAFKQKDFRIALEAITMEGGDADTNGAVAGALLGCKLGVDKLPGSWVGHLLYKDWLDKIIEKFYPFVLNESKEELSKDVTK